MLQKKHTRRQSLSSKLSSGINLHLCKTTQSKILVILLMGISLYLMTPLLKTQRFPILLPTNIRVQLINQMKMDL